MSAGKQQLLEKIKASNRLPMLPTIALKVIELNSDPDLYAAKVAEVLAQDPVLTARLLSATNSAMFNFQREVTSLTEAVAILGTNLAMSIATGFAVVDAFHHRASPDSGFDYEYFWRKSVLGAIAALEMRDELAKGISSGDLFTASLMQDIGMLALESIAGRKYSAMMVGARSHIDLVELERRAFGLDHAEVGKAVLEHWRLPEVHCQAVLHSHDLLDRKPVDQIDDLQFGVALSGMLAEQWIAETESVDILDGSIRASISRISEDGMRRTVAGTIQAVPAASSLFGIQLLDPRKIENVA